MSSRKLFYIAAIGLFAVMLLPLTAQKAPNAGYSVHEKAAYMEQNLVNFIRPGVKVKIVSAAIAKDGTITARVNITDPKGLPLDRDGITTPGPVSMSLIAAYIPAGQKQFVAAAGGIDRHTGAGGPAAHYDHVPHAGMRAQPPVHFESGHSLRLSWPGRAVRAGHLMFVFHCVTFT
jgi:hypothetical protein